MSFASPVTSPVRIRTGGLIQRNLDSKGRLHRVDGPAITSPYSEEWYYRGKAHRVDGPAIINNDESYAWYVNGYRIDSWRQLQEYTYISNERLLELSILWCDCPPKRIK
jgi:hypothetical protein